MLILHARFKTTPDNRTKMLEIANGMIAPSNTEEGCISYEFFQDAFNPNSFIFVERWNSREALELHFRMPYFKDFDSRVGELLEGPPSVISYEVSEEEVII